jgi:hypothetical protein
MGEGAGSLTFSLPFPLPALQHYYSKLGVGGRGRGRGLERKGNLFLDNKLSLRKRRPEIIAPIKY